MYAGEPAIVINALYNTWSGPGGGTRHLQDGGDLGLDARGKAKLLLEVVLRKGIKRSANSTNGLAAIGASLALSGVLAGVAMLPANGGSTRRREQSFRAAVA